ncbi:helix-turn-helix domain-containing protein [Bacillus sp. PS06]|uniref:helix-turn-helix domain-containing protein n=1 Tax=Bacillus sp. PS06 TaxID=2764176 RepID=UPI00177FC476|nr:helix-turn-helix transcriptional regulator [Bacillus sp. PS06]MBD8071319.1 helix-turn-helix transcriptional regulator [Bacillus sp. PS06]
MTKQLGERIKYLRIDKGMTLKELGTAIHFNYSNLSKIERGQRKPTIEFLESLSAFYNIHISYFFEESKGNSTLDWQHLLEEMKQKNITFQELRELVNCIDQPQKVGN